MLEMFQYDFMRRAFIAAVLIAVIAPCIGMIIVLKRISAVGEAAGHSALAGIAFGLLVGWDPLLGAVLFSLLAVGSIEFLRKRFHHYTDLAPMIVLSAGIGLTAVLSGLIKSGGTSLNSFMFGSIVAISDLELWMTVILSVIVAITSIILYKELFYITFDEEGAQIAGVPVRIVNLIFTILTALTVAAASRTVGALMVVSLLVLPVACAITIGKSYKGTFLWSILFAELFTVGGLILSYLLDLRPGGTIVLLGVAVLIIVMLFFGKKD